MENEIVLSQWGQELDRKIVQMEGKITNSQKKIGEGGYNPLQVEIEIKSGIDSLETLKKQKALYVPSRVIGQIDALQDEINSRSIEFEKLIASGNTEVEKIGQQIAAAQIKADIAKQFNGSTDSDQELTKLIEEMAKAYGMEKDAIIADVKKAGNYDVFIDNIKYQIINEKTIDLLKNSAK